MSTSTAVGAWSSWSFAPNAQATEVFKAVTSKLIGVGYKLLASASQLVNGTNYAFIAEASIPGPGSSFNYPVLIHAYQPINGEPTLEGIEKLGPPLNQGMGSYGSWSFPASANELTVFGAAIHLLGVNYKPLGATSQVVAGTNYVFLCEGKVVSPDGSEFAALVEIFQPLPGQGEPSVRGIKRILAN